MRRVMLAAVLALPAVWCNLALARPFVRGDVDEAGTINLTDAVLLLQQLFMGFRIDCQDAGDIDDDGKLNITDPIALLGFMFMGSSRPPDPFPACGLDPSPDSLTCRFFSACPPSPCGGIAGLSCEDFEFCKFPQGECQTDDLMGVCRPLPQACLDVFEPVCGCDGKTYPNECEIDRAGVAIDHLGPCPVD